MRPWLFGIPLGCCLMMSGAAVAASPGSGAADACVDVMIGGESTYSCFNQQIARSIPPRRFSAGSDLPVGANIPAPAAGTFNQAATAEQLGTAFGHSAVPQRPPPVSYPAPLLPAR